MKRLFVYGTLKRGERNHARLAAATFLGPATTRDAAFSLAEFASVSRPGARTPEMQMGGVWRIAGELYELTEGLLAEIDAFERVGADYQRLPLPLLGGGTAEAYLRATTGTRTALASPLHLVVADGVASWSERVSA